MKEDKILHFIVCLAAAIFSPMLAVGLALGKEYGDKHATGNHWCWWDIAADALGAAVGTVVHLIIFPLP